MTTRAEIAEGKKAYAEYVAQVGSSAAKRDAQKATKYSDETIKAMIDLAANVNVPPEISLAKSAIAQNMMAYNRMIDERWG